MIEMGKFLENRIDQITIFVVTMIRLYQIKDYVFHIIVKFLGFIFFPSMYHDD
jgi:hypothetical protein